MQKKNTRNVINALLYSTESITALLFSVVSVSLIARHFGPENLARYSLAQSISTLFIVFATLGLEQFIIKELSRNKLDAEYITSILIGMLVGWIFYVGCVVAYYLVTKKFSHDLFLIITVVLSTLFLKVIFIRIYLQAQNKPKPIAISSFISRIIAIGYLLTGSHFEMSFDLMMLYMPLQAFSLLIFMLGNQRDFIKAFQIKKFKFTRIISSVKEATPILGSTILYYFYNQSDIIIMSNILDAKQLGLYSAAIRLIPQAAFIGYILVATFYSEMDKKLLTDRVAFDHHVRLLLSIQFGIGILLSIFASIFSTIIIKILYGEKYAESSQVLAISCWAWVFILPAALYSRLLIMLGYAKYELIKMIIVAPIIITMNYLFIKNLGINGSAAVYVFSYFTVDFLIYFLFKNTRHLAFIGLHALKDAIFSPLKTTRLFVSLMKLRSHA